MRVLTERGIRIVDLLQKIPQIREEKINKKKFVDQSSGPPLFIGSLKVGQGDGCSQSLLLHKNTRCSAFALSIFHCPRPLLLQKIKQTLSPLSFYIYLYVFIQEMSR